MKVAFVLGTTAGGTGRHVQMLAAGCVVRGIPCAVFGPRETQRDFGFGIGGGAEFGAVDIGDRPNVRDGLAVLRLRRLLGGSGADVVHAHGLRAGALATLALSLRPSGGPLPLVVTVHNAPPSAGVNGAIYQALELIVARSAAAVLCVSADLEERMRRAGARATLAAPWFPPWEAPGREVLSPARGQPRRRRGRPSSWRPGGSPRRRASPP